MATENPISTIYVREITENDSLAFNKIKTEFGFGSNNKVIKTLFHRYLELQKDHTNLILDSKELRTKLINAENKLNIVNAFAEMLKDLNHES